LRTITSARDIDRLFSEGRRTSHDLLSILVAPSPGGPDAEGRVMFVAGRKLGGAVTRNRCKRVLRESCRRAGGPWRGHDVALAARAGIPDAPAGRIDQALASCLRRAGLGDTR